MRRNSPITKGLLVKHKLDSRLMIVVGVPSEHELTCRYLDVNGVYEIGDFLVEELLVYGEENY